VLNKICEAENITRIILNPNIKKRYTTLFMQHIQRFDYG